ncbi:FUSC family protein [Oceanobacillus polygoni]|uniref:Membrane protein YccC n=1 Tax=Oceanobacillus polygoni TaxID=1235259 RepID=A0A9X0YVX0_9BACI|nr:FUSC family protein [Oceanobacillus polygoni]MBP2079447.1 putative membrane protein YccC [Oceanobacillus polygoni]
MGKHTTFKDSTFIKTLIQAFEIKRNPLPWNKAILAGVSAAFPAGVGLMLGDLQSGLAAGIGGFTYLYMFNEPYAERAKKLFFVMIGLSLSIGLGMLLAPYPFLFSLMVGVLGFLFTFLFGALKIPGPAAIFFVLVFTITSAMPIDPSLAPMRAGLTLLGGAFAWVLAMSGWFINPHGPERNAIKRVYIELASLIDVIGTAEFSKERQKTLQTLRDTGDTLSRAYISWQNSAEFRKLYYLYEQANLIYAEVIEFYATPDTKPPSEIAQTLREIANKIDKHTPDKPIQFMNDTETNLRLQKMLNEATHILNGDDERLGKEIHVPKRSLKETLSGSFHKNSFVFISAIRYGFILFIASIIAFSFEFDRSYWIVLSCGAVMLGSTIITTFHRAIQRSLGTIVGVLIAALLLSTHPDGIFIILVILLLTFLTELFIPRNYAIAVCFITPNAIFMAENTSQIYDLRFFATARITDILIGCAIGLVGIFLFGRRSASSRLPHLIAKTIRSQMQLLALMFSGSKDDVDITSSSESKKMHTNLKNLSLVYRTALGEIPRNQKALEQLWSVIFSIEQLGYLLEAASRKQDLPSIKDDDLAQLMLVFEMMAKSAKQMEIPKTRRIPEIPGFPQIQKEIGDLQVAMQVGKSNLV